MKKLIVACFALILFSCSNNDSEVKFRYLEQYGQYQSRYDQDPKEYEKVVDQIGLIMNDTLTQKTSNQIDSLILHIREINQLEELVMELARVMHNDRSILFYLFRRTLKEVPNSNTNYWIRLQGRLTPKEHSYEASKIIFSKNYDFQTFDTLTTDWWRIESEFHRWTLKEMDTSGMSIGRRKLLLEIVNEEDIFRSSSMNAKPHTRIAARDWIRDVFDPERKHTRDIFTQNTQ